MRETGRAAGWSWAPTEDSPMAALVLYRLRWALLSLLTLAVVATLGYMLFEGYGLIDAVYMTVITLGTIGYGEIHPLDTVGRFLTIGVIIVGFTTLAYALSVLTNLFVSGEPLRQLQVRRSKRMLEALEHHVIVVGFGRVGQAIVTGLRELGWKCVVIDRNAERRGEIQNAEAREVIGDATSEDDLREAGIDRADALIAAADSDAENLVVVLTARSTRPDLRIVSRVNEATWLERIKRAGADVVQSPYPSYGMSLAAAATSSSVLDIHDLPRLGLGTEEIEIPAESPMIGLAPAALTNTHPWVHVVALRRDQDLHLWHEFDGVLRAGDILVALGAPQHLMRLVSEVMGSDERPE